MRVLLTGASGFIGQHLLGALLAEGHHVVCAGRGDRKGTDPRLSTIHADFVYDTEQSIWLARLSGIDVVINTVRIFREAGSLAFERLHLETPRALFAACAAAHEVKMDGLLHDPPGRLPLHSKWIMWSIALHVLAGACWLPVVWLQMRMRDIAQEAARTNTGLSPQYWRYFRIWVTPGMPAFIAFVVIFWLMVAKPV